MRRAFYLLLTAALILGGIFALFYYNVLGISTSACKNGMQIACQFADGAPEPPPSGAEISSSCTINQPSIVRNGNVVVISGATPSCTQGVAEVNYGYRLPGQSTSHIAKVLGGQKDDPINWDVTNVPTGNYEVVIDVLEIGANKASSHSFPFTVQEVVAPVINPKSVVEVYAVQPNPVMANTNVTVMARIKPADGTTAADYKLVLLADDGKTVVREVTADEAFTITAPADVVTNKNVANLQAQHVSDPSKNSDLSPINLTTTAYVIPEVTLSVDKTEVLLNSQAMLTATYTPGLNCGAWKADPNGKFTTSETARVSGEAHAFTFSALENHTLHLTCTDPARNNAEVKSNEVVIHVVSELSAPAAPAAPEAVAEGSFAGFVANSTQTGEYNGSTWTITGAPATATPFKIFKAGDEHGTTETFMNWTTTGFGEPGVRTTEDCAEADADVSANCSLRTNVQETFKHDGPAYIEMPEADPVQGPGHILVTGSYFTVTMCTGVTIELSTPEDVAAHFYGTGSMNADGTTPHDGNCQIKIDEYNPGFTMGTVLPNGQRISNDYRIQQVEAAIAEECGNDGCLGGVLEFHYNMIDGTYTIVYFESGTKGVEVASNWK